MARTIKEIKKQMTDTFMGNSTLREAYGLTGNTSWEQNFSAVSLENILIYIVATAICMLEMLFDGFKTDVDVKISQAVVASVPWYHKIARSFQFGDELVFDEQTQQFKYAHVDESKQVVKYVSVRDMGGSIQILASADVSGKPVPLTENVLTAFKYYLNRCKIAGVNLSVRSINADKIQMSVMVQIDPMVIGNTGKRLSDGKYPVIEAVNSYLANILYGGTFNKTKLVDAIQNVTGVVDITLGTCSAKTSDATEYKDIPSNNYTAFSGCFISENLETTISYVV